jgi:hypothetical protein
VRYIHDQHLPTLFMHAVGAVVVNSTAGLAAIHQRVPTKVMGNAIFDMAGLTWQGTIDSFWRAGEATAIDYDLYLRFRSYLIRNCQINDSFYRLSSPRVEVFTAVGDGDLKHTMREERPAPRDYSIIRTYLRSRVRVAETGEKNTLFFYKRWSTNLKNRGEDS